MANSEQVPSDSQNDAVPSVDNTPVGDPASPVVDDPPSTDAGIEPITPIAEQLPSVADWLPEQLIPVWHAVDGYPLLGALIVASAFYFIAFAFRAMILASVGRLVARTETGLDNVVLHHLRKPLFTSIFLFGLMLATQLARLPIGTGAIVNMLASIVVVSWMLAFIRVSNAALDALSANPQVKFVERQTLPVLDITIKLLVILVSSYVLLVIWGINPIGWLASAGIVGIAVGFAAKDTLANLFSGFFILVDAPYQMGDYINLDSGERGKVTSIGLRSTRLLTRDDVEITIPNAVIGNAKITNESGGPYEKMRVRVAVGVAYGSDVDQVEELLLEVARANSELSRFPEPRVRLRAFGGSSLDHELLVWIERPEDRGRILHEVNIAVYKRFAEHGVEIPYAKQDVYIKEMPPR